MELWDFCLLNDISNLRPWGRQFTCRYPKQTDVLSQVGTQPQLLGSGVPNLDVPKP